MTLEEMIQQLKDAQTVNGAQTLRHEARLKEHQQWLEDNELASSKHRIAMAEINANLKQASAKLTELAAAQLATEERLQALIDSLRGQGGNGKH